MSTNNETIKLIEHDLTSEEFREYDFGDRVYRINDPVKLYYREDGYIHRVLDSRGVVHCVPGPGGRDGCVLRWKTRANEPHVSF